MSKMWRDAATLMILARDASKGSKFDYKILTFKRTEKTSFYASSLAFPGGSMDKQDESLGWINFFRQHKVCSEEIRRSASAKKPLIYDPRSGKLERELSLRLTAIRETFEELGVVLCKSPDDPSDSAFSSYFHDKNCDIPEWQYKIHNSHETLQSFCDNFNLIPNILEVYEWSVWLTPTFYPRRFETAFFLVTLNSIPPVYPEAHEVQDFYWHTPEEVLNLHNEKTLWLPPPQYFEIHRFLNYTKIDDIAKFAKERDGKDVPMILPINYLTQDGMCLVYPGDDLYPEDANPYEPTHDVQKYAEKTYEELKAESKNFSRILMTDMFASHFLCNTDDGLLPARSKELQGKL